MVDSPSPAPAPAPSMVPAVAGAAVAAAEAAVPMLLAFNPLFALLLTAIKAHYNATGTWPTEAEVTAAVPTEYQAVLQTWQSWKPSGDGTLPASTVSTL